MKSIIYSTIFLLLCAGAATAQKNIDQVLRKYKNDEGVMNMNFTGDLLSMMASSDKKLQSSVELVDVLVFEKDQDISSSDKEKIESVLSRDKYELLVDVKNKDQKVKLYAIDGGKFLNKIYAHVNSSELNAYFILSGKIIFEELAKMNLDFQNGDALKMLGKSGK